jgi:phospholipid/cholesterol/gamma-HCH transport system substrate-binding protein
MAVLRFSKATLFKVLGFAAVSAVLTLVLAVKIGNMQSIRIGPLTVYGPHQYALEAQFRDAAGVFKGDAVKLAGVDVGSVAGTKIENGLGVVEFKVDDSVRIPRDSIIAIRWRNVLGQRFIYIYPGQSTDALFRDGDVVPVSRTEDAGDLGQFLNDLGPILRAINPEEANAFLDSMNTALANNTLGVQQLLDSGANLAGRLGSMDDQIKTLVGTSNTVMSTYARQNRSLARILDDLNVVSIRLDSMKGDLDQFIVNFADVQQRLDRILRDNRGNIDASLSELQALVALLARNSQNLETTLCTLPAGVTPYADTTSWGEWFNVRITKFILRDRHGKTMGSEAESRQNGPSRPSARPYTRCAGGTGGSTVVRAGASHGDKEKPGGPGKRNGATPTVPKKAGFGNVGDLVKSVLGNQGRVPTDA